MVKTKADIQKSAETLAAKMNLFVLSINHSDISEHIEVVIDSPGDITLSCCAEFNREFQNKLEEMGLNYSVTVTTYGAYEPLKYPYQLKKNIGRVVIAKLKTGKECEGVLKQADENKIEIEVTERIPKEKGKGKITKITGKGFSYPELEYVKVKPVF
ncbi:MAG: hypothetical protein N3F09_05005 [Bacteroidia bacterium]|nr:hypothetical protein [Bacteroidia bacterium]